MTIDTFFQTHAYLIEHLRTTVRRSLMDTIDWNYRMICIRGPRGVGRTSFLMQYAKEYFDPQLHQCLLVSMNNFYFHGRGLVDFAGEYAARGGQVLLVDQAFKLPEWKDQLVEIYHKYPYLRVVYSTTSVHPITPEGGEEHELDRITRNYVLHGFSFREYINQQTGCELGTYTLAEILGDHERIQKVILSRVRPFDHFRNYLHHGYYPFYLENRNFMEALLKAMNNMIEVDVLLNKQVELKYLSRLKRLFYLLAAAGEDNTPNVSRLAEEIGTSRATVMNYLEYLQEARLVNMIYRDAGGTSPKKPAAVYLHDTNLLYGIQAPGITEQNVMETFFTNVLWRHHDITKGKRQGLYKIDGTTDVLVCNKARRSKDFPNLYYVKYNTEVTRGNDIPIWLFGFLY